MGQRLENLLGVLAVALGDALDAELATAAGRPGPTVAALAVLAQEPGLGIEQLNSRSAARSRPSYGSSISWRRTDMPSGAPAETGDRCRCSSPAPALLPPLTCSTADTRCCVMRSVCSMQANAPRSSLSWRKCWAA